MVLGYMYPCLVAEKKAQGKPGDEGESISVPVPPSCTDRSGIIAAVDFCAGGWGDGYFPRADMTEDSATPSREIRLVCFHQQARGVQTSEGYQALADIERPVSLTAGAKQSLVPLGRRRQQGALQQATP